MMSVLRTSILYLIIMTALLAGVYPFSVWFASNAVFPYQAGGSLIYKNGHAIGSALLGQDFTAQKYFWPRPSATSGISYQALASSASNLNPAHPSLQERVKDRLFLLQRSHQDSAPVPSDLVTTSGSGLDPDISLSAAVYQIQRVAKARNISPDQITDLINEVVQKPMLGFLGNERVNVVQLNLLLDRSFESNAP